MASGRNSTTTTPTLRRSGARSTPTCFGNELPERVQAQATYLDRVHSDFFQRIEEEEGLDPQRDPLYGEFRRDPDVIRSRRDQIPEEFEIDWDKMLDKTLKGPIARILEAMDISGKRSNPGRNRQDSGVSCNHQKAGAYCCGKYYFYILNLSSRQCESFMGETYHLSSTRQRTNDGNSRD